MYGCASLVTPECSLCLCVCVFVCMWYQIRVPAKKAHYVSDLSKPLQNTQQGPPGTKEPKLGMCRSIISLSKIVQQMRRNHLFSQRNKTTERAVEGVRVGDNREGGSTKFEKVWLDNIRESSWNRWIRTPLPTMSLHLLKSS